MCNPFKILVPPLFVIEFLHRVVDTFDDYFGESGENVIKENCVVVYEVITFWVYEVYYEVLYY